MNARTAKHTRRDVEQAEGPPQDHWIVEMRPLDSASCWRLLAGADAPVGRLGFVYDENPLVLPVNFAVVNRSIFVRTGWGSLVHATTSVERVAFEADALNPAMRTGWSVLVVGTAVDIDDDDPALPGRAQQLESWAPGRRSSWIRILPSTTTGRVIHRQRPIAVGNVPGDDRGW